MIHLRRTGDMHRSLFRRHGPRLIPRRGYVTDTDVEAARRYCMAQLQQSDHDAHLIRRFIPRRAQDLYTALRALNLELVRLPEMVSNPVIGAMRTRFWQDSIEATMAGRPPREPICLLLHHGLREHHHSGSPSSAIKSVAFWVSRLVRTREKNMDNRPFATLASLEEHAENTYSTMMYATLACVPVRSVHVDHLASHIGKACGIVAVLRGIPVLAGPRPPLARGHEGGLGGGDNTGIAGSPSLLLPLDVMADEGLREEDVFRQGPDAPGLQDAVFKVATRANDHLITAREMLKRLRAGEDPGHEFEHQGQDGHVYHDHDESDAARDVRRGFGVLLEAVAAGQWLQNLERANFDPFRVKSGGWRLPWSIWQALSKERI